MDKYGNQIQQDEKIIKPKPVFENQYEDFMIYSDTNESLHDIFNHLIDEEAEVFKKQGGTRDPRDPPIAHNHPSAPAAPAPSR